jgi:hypothetical protein
MNKNQTNTLFISGAALAGLYLWNKNAAGIGKITDYGKSNNGRADAYWNNITVSRNLVGRKYTHAKWMYSTEAIVKKFNLRSIEYGNYMTEQDRLDHTVALAQSLVDLSKCLGIPQSKIGFKKTLNIAMGARGQSSAAAHYERGTHDINLTKNSGAGALAHEYGHFLDNALAVYGLKAGRGEFASGGRSTSKKNIYENTSKNSIPALSDFIFDKLFYKENGEPTSFYEDQKDRTPYYNRRTEIFARLTEAVVYLKSQSKGIRNLYLVNQYDSSMPPRDLVKKVMSKYLVLINKI